MFTHFQKRWLFSYLSLFLISTISHAEVCTPIPCNDIVSDNPTYTTFTNQLPSKINSLTASSDGAWLAAGFENGQLMMWDMASKAVHIDTQLADEPIIQVMFSPNSRLLVAVYADSYSAFDAIASMQIWDVATKQEIATFEHVYVPMGFSDDSNLFAFYQQDRIVVWNTEVQSTQQNIDVESKQNIAKRMVITPPIFSADKQKLAASGIAQYQCLVADVNTGDVLMTIDDCLYAKIAIDNQTVMTSRYSFIDFWDIATSSYITHIESSLIEAVVNLQFSPDGQHFISQFSDKVIGEDSTLLWDMETKTTTNVLTFPEWFKPNAVSYNDLRIFRHVYSDNGQYIFNFKDDFDDSVGFYAQNRITGKRSVTLSPSQHASAVTHIVDNQLVSAMDDGSILLWDIKQLPTRKQHFEQSITFNKYNYPIKFFPLEQTQYIENHWITNLTSDSTKAQFRSLALTPRLEFGDWLVAEHNDDIIKNPVDVTSDGHLLAMAFDGNKVKLLDVKTRQEIAQWEESNEVGYIQFSEDNRILVVITQKNTLSFWDIDTQTKISQAQLTFELEQYHLLSDDEYRLNDRTSLFSPHNDLYFFADNSAILVEVNTGKVLLTLDNNFAGASTSISQSAFTPDNSTLLFTQTIEQNPMLYAYGDVDFGTHYYMGRYQDNGEYQLERYENIALITHNNPLLTHFENQVAISSEESSESVRVKEGKVEGNAGQTRFWDLSRNMVEFETHRIRGQYVAHWEWIFVVAAIDTVEKYADHLLTVWDVAANAAIADTHGRYKAQYDNLIVYTSKYADKECKVHVYDLSQRREVMQTAPIPSYQELDANFPFYPYSTSDLTSCFRIQVALDQNHLIVADTHPKSPSLSVWDMENGQRIHHITDYNGEEFELTPDGDFLMYTTAEQRLAIIDTMQFEMIPQLAKSKNTIIPATRQIIAHKQQPFVAIINTDLNLAGIKKQDGIQIWNSLTNEIIGEQKTAKIYSAVWHPEQLILAYSDYAQRIQLWNVETNTIVPLSNTEPAYSMAWQPNGDLIAAASENSLVRIWDVATGTMLAAQLAHDNPVSHITWSPDGHLFASSAGTELYIWNGQTGEAIRRFVAHNDMITDFEFNADSSMLISIGKDQTIHVWDVATAQKQTSIEDTQATKIAIHPTKSIMAYGTDNSVKFYNFAQNRFVANLKQHAFPIFDVTFNNEDTLTLITIEENISQNQSQIVQSWFLKEFVQ